MYILFLFIELRDGQFLEPGKKQAQLLWINWTMVLLRLIQPLDQHTLTSLALLLQLYVDPIYR
jgi:hypothetical protein